VVAQGHKSILDKPKLSSDFLKLSSEMAVVIIVASVPLNFRDGGPVIEVMSGFAEGVVGRCGASEEVKKPGGHGFSNFFVEVVGREQ
jgi:hypothetical protein